jgi:hypothetical protein
VHRKSKSAAELRSAAAVPALANRLRREQDGEGGRPRSEHRLGDSRTDTANQRGGSEWETIKILLEGDGGSNKMNTASNTRLRLTTQVGQAHVATGVLLDLGTNKQPSEPKLTNTHSENLHSLLPVLHRSDRWPAPVRPVDSAGQTGGYNSRTTSVPESLSDFSRP